MVRIITYDITFATFEGINLFLVLQLFSHSQILIDLQYFMRLVYWMKDLVVTNEMKEEEAITMTKLPLSLSEFKFKLKNQVVYLD